MLELDCFDDARGLGVEPLMPGRSRVRFQTKWDTRVYDGRGRSRFASGTRLLINRVCKRTRDSGTPEENSTSLKKAKLESAYLQGPREPLKPELAPGAIAGAGGVSSQ